MDVETTGLSPSSSRLIELAIIHTDSVGTITGEWSTRLFPEGPVQATHIHGITDADVADAPRFAEVAETVIQSLDGRAVVAHNVAFDLAFLRAEFSRAGYRMPDLPSFCTLEESRYFLPHLDRRRLSDCCYACQIWLQDEHSALGDARATAHLLARFLRGDTGRAPTADHSSVLEAALAPLRQGAGAWEPQASPVRSFHALLPAPTPRAGRRAAPVAAHRYKSLAELLSDFGVDDALLDDAPRGLGAYLELLAQALEDGHLSSEELAGLGELAEANGLTLSQVMEGHRCFVLALAFRALEDGHVSQAERDDMAAVAATLELGDEVVAQLLEDVSGRRLTAQIDACKPLPPDWSLGEPLRVGDRVAFTGCDFDERQHLEDQAPRHGIRVMGNVSRRTALLVTDGSIDGGKLAAARKLGTRLVSPGDFAVLIQNVQPPQDQSPTRQLSSVQVVTHPVGADPAAVRAWARQAGFTVGTRGRLGSEVLDAYRKAMDLLA